MSSTVPRSARAHRGRPRPCVRQYTTYSVLGLYDVLLVHGLAAQHALKAEAGHVDRLLAPGDDLGDGAACFNFCRASTSKHCRVFNILWYRKYSSTASLMRWSAMIVVEKSLYAFLFKTFNN